MNGRPRQGNFQVRALNLDPSETDKFCDTLPRKTSLSEVIRRFIHDECERIEREKNVIASNHDKGAIKINGSGPSTIQSTLDKYIPPWILRDDWQEQNEIQDKMTYDDQLLAVTALNKTVQRFKSRLY
jgi:hypothetical protein